MFTNMTQHYKVDAEIVNAVKNASTVKEAKMAMAGITGWKKTKINTEYNNITNGKYDSLPNSGIMNSEKVDASDSEDGQIVAKIEYEKNYIYNDDTDKYIVYLNAAARNVVFEGSLIRALLKAYSDLNGSANSINEICRKFKIARPIFTELKDKMNWSHSSLPKTDEELVKKDADHIVEDLIEDKKFDVWQRFQKKDWQNTQADALKYRAMIAGKFNPFKDFLAAWQPPAYVPIFQEIEHPNIGDCTYVVGAFDWHYGALAEKRYLHKQDEWNANLAKEAIRKYTAQIAKDVLNKGYGFDGCVLLLGGDLYHSILGRTTKGTPLLTDNLRDTQFEGIFNCLVEFISGLLSVFRGLEIHHVRGNHGGDTDFALGLALQAYFHSEERLTFNNYSTRTAVIRIKDVLLLLDHGASDTYEAAVPKAGKARESYVQSLLLANPEKLIGVKQKLFVQGDKHHFEQQELNDFEYIMFGALPSGDKYADNLNLHARPRQNCLVIGEGGVKDVVHHYFD